MKRKRSRRLERLLLLARFLMLLLWEFRWPLIVFWSLVLGGGFVLMLTYGHHQIGYAEACFGVFLLIFLEPYLEFPPEWYLQPLFFLLPIVGLGAVADSIVRLAYLTFTQKSKLPEWQRMVASLYRNHVLVVGVGKVGYQILREVHALGEQAVAVEKPGAESSILEEIVDLGIPVIRGDGRNAKTLEQAGVRHARAVILVTSDDLTNLDAGLTARDLNPEARVVLRLFDDSLAAKVRGAFAMPAISTSQVAAPAFIAAATGRRVYQDFHLGGQHLHLVDLKVCAGGGLVGQTVGAIQADRTVNVVMHQGPGGVNVNPDHSVLLRPNDELLIIAPLPRLVEMEKLNRPPGHGNGNGHGNGCPNGGPAGG